ncbi:hypothetical protein L1987_87085 [Smallanthus sonchifolius]|nr:hypothetical protein L1987_87085 [Smallanthus sonchifolius]
MATTSDGESTYQSGGARGKFRKRPVRRSAQATPYDRPPTALRNNSPSLYAKLVDPVSRLIYVGADRLFGIFRKRLPPVLAQRLPVPQSVTPGTNHRTKRQRREIKQTRRENLRRVRVPGRAGESNGVCESGNQQADLEVLQAAPPLVELRGLFVWSSFHVRDRVS